MKRALLVLVLLTAMVGAAGCTTDNFVGVCKVSTGAIGVKTLAAETGVIDKPTAIANMATVKTLEICIDGWYQNIIDGNLVTPEQVACAINCMNKLNGEAKALKPAVEKAIVAMYGIQVKIGQTADANTVEAAYRNFKYACAGYYYAVTTIFGDEPVNAGLVMRRLR
jgi:hypothetical protein